MDTDFSAGDDAGIEAADGIDVDISVVVNMIDLKPQFIHMSGQHDSRAAVGVVYRNRVAMRVNGDVIRVFLRFRRPDFTYGSFVPGWTRRIEHGFEKST